MGLLAAGCAALLCALIALGACAARTPVDAPASPSPSATEPGAPVFAMHVVQTIHSGPTGQQTESIFSETAEIGESYTIRNASGAWTLTFTILDMRDGVVYIRTDHEMVFLDDVGARKGDTFPMPYGVVCRIGEPIEDPEVRYLFTFRDALAETPPPGSEETVRFSNRQILGNIRRTLHENDKAAFTPTELELILFVELKGRDIEDVAELRNLPNIETLMLKNTCVQDLSPLAGCKRIHTIVLLENSLLDVTTLPTLPSLRMLSITGKYSEEDMLSLAERLPECSIVANLEN